MNLDPERNDKGDGVDGGDRDDRGDGTEGGEEGGGEEEGEEGKLLQADLKS